MTFSKILAASAGLLVCSAVAAGGPRVTVVEGFVAHGINTYNDTDIGDYSAVAPTVAMLNAVPKVKEIGAFDAGGSDASTITASTDRSLPLATIRSFFDFFNPGGTVDSGLFNLPLDGIGTNFFGFGDFSQRAPIEDFADAAPGTIYSVKGSNRRPTVGDWEKISGQVRIQCRANGTASAQVTIRDALPKAVYTLWDVGVLNPVSDNEQPYAVPFGGLPNLLVTDAEGCGFRKVELPYCPTQACEGNTACTSYISAFYHWDAQAYGASPSATFTTPSMPVGVVASNQIVWPMTGTLVSEPATRFKPARPGCPR